jgi:cytochrome c peroxidase
LGGLSYFYGAFLTLILACSVFSAAPVNAQNPLSSVPVSAFEDPRITVDFVVDRAAAIRLGKALFWDMQVGSDGRQACASCHFHAGADSRIKNQLGPGINAGDTVFGNQDFPQFAPNYTLQAADFPLHERTLQGDRDAPVLRDVNDVVSSQGVFLSDFVDVVLGSPLENVTPVPDPVFNVGGVNVRRVEPRNTPSVINAVFNVDNFWEGRAKHIFNGVNPFGILDVSSDVLVDDGGGLTGELVRIENASLASQAVGPPLSEFEMSARGRTFPDIGKKMLSLRPLALQQVAANDSVLGPLRDPGGRGLNTTYPAMIQAAFQPRFWNNNTQVVTFPGGVRTIDPGTPGSTSEFTQMEVNFSLFFGLAVQLYQSTLVSDETSFDRFEAGDVLAMSADALRGLTVFQGKGRCVNCHGGSALTNASIQMALGLDPDPEPELASFILSMAMAQGNALYDNGFYNIAVRPSGEDSGRSGTAPFNNPPTGSDFPLAFARLAVLNLNAQLGLLPDDIANFLPGLPAGANPADPIATNGAFKTPGLRNVELTGPYFHNGSAATLEEVVEVYSRGGNFPDANIADLDADIRELSFSADETAALVAFLKALTDERVRNESAPFDHPELFVANGLAGDGSEDFIRLPPVGTGGRSEQGLPPLTAFPTPPLSVGDPTPPSLGGNDPAAAGAGGGGGGGCFIDGLFN